LKATHGEVVGKTMFKERADSTKDESAEISESSAANMDELIMIMMPRVAWDAFQELAKEYGSSMALTMSAALKLLKENLDKGKKEDGS